MSTSETNTSILEEGTEPQVVETQQEAKARKAAEAKARRDAINVGGEAASVAVKSKDQTPKDTVTVTTEGLQEIQVEVKPQVIQNTKLEDVPVGDYFFTPEGKRPIAPPFFNKAIGYPVTREDLRETFNKVFKLEDGFVFLKSEKAEVYHILIPLLYTEIGAAEDSIYGDYQVHSISFIPDGSVNLDRLTNKLKEVATLVGYSKR